MLSSFNILTTSVSYIDRVTEKYGGTLKIVVSPIGCDIKKAIKQIKDDKYIKSIYYPGVETNSKNLDAKLNVEYVVGNEFKKDEMKIKPPISYIGLNVNLIKYSHEKFEFIEGRMYENDRECIINKSDLPQYVWASLKVGDKILLTGSGEDMELTISGIVKGTKPIYSDSAGQLLYTTTENIVSLAKRYQNPNKIVKSSIPENFMDNDIIDINFADPNNPFNINELYYVNGREEYGYKCVVELKDSKLNNDFKIYLIENVKEPKLFATNFYPYEDEMLDIIGNTNRMSLLFLIIIIIMLIITTVVTSIMYLSNRKYEFAVLCSIGMSKPKIMGSYIIETLVFMFFTSLSAIVIGQFLFIFGLSNTLKAPFEGLIDTSLPIANLLFFNGIAVLAGMSIVVVVTVLISMIYLLSFEPLKIFNKRYS